MLYSKFFTAAALAALANMVNAGAIERPWAARRAPLPLQPEQLFEKRQNNGTGGDQVLLAGNIQTNSQKTGQEADSDPEQADSATDNANFINFCSGTTLTNGLQNEGGSCNGIVMGKIPSTGAMTSAIITNPAPGDDLQADTDFDVNVQLANLAAGSFTNPDNTYYAAPQDLDGSGTIIGHCHVTIQDMGGDIATQTPMDANDFAFFLGINDAGNGQGLLTAPVTGGLPAGTYRVCTMNSASNHQPVLMPIAQRGAQDDCTKFTIGQGGGNGNGTAKRDTRYVEPARRAELYDRTKTFAQRAYVA